MMIKHKLEKNTVINKIVPDFMDTLYIKETVVTTRRVNVKLKTTWIF